MNPNHDTTRNLAHLHPDRIRIGTVGVFAGDWAWTFDTDGAARVPVGYVGTLIDRFFPTTKIIHVPRCRTQDGHPHLADERESR
jgi:hypothetical protein